MLLAVALRSLPALTLADKLALLRDCGLHAAEADLIVLRESSVELKNVSISTLDATILDPASNDWAEGIQNAIAMAAELAVPIVIVAAGDDHGEVQLRQRLLDRHRRAADLAAEREMLLVWDTLPGICGDARAMHQAIQEANHPSIRLNFDTGRYLAENPWSSGEVGLQRVCGRLASVRLTSFTVGVEPAEYPPLGQGGDVDFSRTRQFLAGIEFGGPCTIAFWPRTRRPPTAHDCEAWLRQSVEHLRGCGWFE